MNIYYANEYSSVRCFPVSERSAPAGACEHGRYIRRSIGRCCSFPSVFELFQLHTRNRIAAVPTFWFLIMAGQVVPEVKWSLNCPIRRRFHPPTNPEMSLYRGYWSSIGRLEPKIGYS
jgi:hypothetical protein